MAMPQTVEKSKHYRHREAFLSDQGEMARRGWKASAIRTYDVRNGPLSRILLRRPTHAEVDVSYTRKDWSTDDVE